MFECKAEECGGSAGRSSSGGGGDMSLSMYLYPEERISDPNFSNGNCAQTSDVVDQRNAAAELPDEGAHISILTYAMHDDLYCKAFDSRTINLVHRPLSSN